MYIFTKSGREFPTQIDFPFPSLGKGNKQINGCKMLSLIDIRKGMQGLKGRLGLVAGSLVPDEFTPSFEALGQMAALHGHPPTVGPAGLYK